MDNKRIYKMPDGSYLDFDIVSSMNYFCFDPIRAEIRVITKFNDRLNFQYTTNEFVFYSDSEKIKETYKELKDKFEKVVKAWEDYLSS